MHVTVITFYTSGNVEHCWRVGATQLGICSGCIMCRQRTAFPSWSKTEHAPVGVLYIGRTVSRWAERSLPHAVVHQAAGMAGSDRPGFPTTRRGPPGSWHAAVCARAMLALGTMMTLKRYSLGQSPKVAEHAVEWRRVVDRSARHVCGK